MPNDSAVVLTNVSKSFGKKSVLKSITATIDHGKSIGLLGENGVGKTTLFRILLDVITATEGEVRVLGRCPDGTGEIRQRIGYVPEKPAFHPFMTIGDVLKFRSTMYKDWDSGHASAYQRLLKLNSETKVSEASKGTLAKLAWICATAHHPPLLLLDEPTSGLDLLVRESVLTGLIRELSEEGKTIFVANHRMEELMNVIDEIWILAHGTIARRVDVNEIRASARRITGRLRREIPKDLRIIEEHRSGSVVSWLAVDKETFAAIQELALLEQMEVSTIQPEVSLRALLKQEEAQ
jgi:ABC-2 type transport system ATP-binding protein